MEKLISCCGIDCSKCEARIATINNDEELRKTIAEKWRASYGSQEITPEMINCTGCRLEGAKIGYCGICEIRKCVSAKGFETCAECSELETCNIVSMVHKQAPEALANLKNLN
jgi:hypothetical protein